jgi:exodeoxyribonuclease VII large subunit
VLPVAIQGPSAVSQIIDALAVLDRDPGIDVIILARGGGSVEDLLPFSDEALCRAVFACRTPVISAIGHETDTPLVDFVADVRASTPTDAAKRAVPDLSEEVRGLAAARARLDRAMDNLLEREQHRLDAMRSRPALARPYLLVEARLEQVLALRSRADRTLTHRLERAEDELQHTLARLRGLSPLATLERGYAIVQLASDSTVVRDPAQTRAGERLRLRLARGDLAATVSVADVSTMESES